jgi:WD40 repeat protein
MFVNCVSHFYSIWFAFAVRSAKFIVRENWVIAATDDKYIRVYNYEKMEKIIEFEGHTDYIRSLAVHPFLPYVVSASDDQVLKLWNWEKNWSCDKTFEGNSHYVMQVAFNPKDPSTFASASLDGTLKVYKLCARHDIRYYIESESDDVQLWLYIDIENHNVMV